MSRQKLGIAVGCVVIVACALAAVSCGPIGANPPPKDDGIPVVDVNFTGMAPGTQAKKPRSDDAKPVANDAARNAKSAAAKNSGNQPSYAPRGPLTCADATRMGRNSVGQRVRWHGMWTNSDGETVKGKRGAVHVFNTPDFNGDYTFAFPFMAEDTNPLERVLPGQNVGAHFDAKWGPSRIVIVSGTIARVTRLIVIGSGTRDNVPVLTDITISLDY